MLNSGAGHGQNLGNLHGIVRMNTMDDVDMDSVLAPIDSPAAWKGAELQASDAWRRRLTATEIAALTRAAEETKGIACPGFGAAAFRVPEVEPLLTWMARAPGHGPGVGRG